MLAAPGSAGLWINGIARVEVATKSGRRKLGNVAMVIAITYLFCIRASITLGKFIRTLMISKTIVEIIVTILNLKYLPRNHTQLKKHLLSGLVISTGSRDPHLDLFGMI